MIRAVALSLAAASLTLAAQAQQGSFTTTIGRHVGPSFQLQRYSCPPGHEMATITNPVCLPPIKGSCTAYWCIDPVSGNRTLARSVLPGYTNPMCVQDHRQTEPCSNEVDYLPTTKDLVKMLPDLYPNEYLAVPMLHPDKLK